MDVSGLVIKCQSDEFAIFNPPSGETCQQWAGAFVDANGGYLNNPNATSSCQYCQYSVGDEYYTPLNISFDNRWRDAFILFAYFSMFNFVWCSRLLVTNASIIVFNMIVTISKCSF